MAKIKGWEKISEDCYINKRTKKKLFIYRSGNGWKCGGCAGYEPSNKVVARKRCVHFMRGHPSG